MESHLKKSTWVLVELTDVNQLMWGAGRRGNGKPNFIWIPKFIDVNRTAVALQLCIWILAYFQGIVSVQQVI